jgi:hypothetical protein
LKLNHEMILNVLFEQRITNVCVLNLWRL